MNTEEQARYDSLLAAARRSLSWLSSYPGGGAVGCYDQMRSAIVGAEPSPPQAVAVDNDGKPV